MGMQAEFNWYIVLKDGNIMDAQTHNEFDERNLSIYKKYNFLKSDYRIYPMDTPLPIIYNDNCIGMGQIVNLRWGDGQTWLVVEPLIIFQKDDPTASLYEQSFQEYQEEQQKINDGGKIHLSKLVNPKERTRL